MAKATQAGTLERVREPPRAAKVDGVGARFANAVRRLWSTGATRDGANEEPFDLSLDMVAPPDLEPGGTDADHALLQWLWGPGHLTPGGSDFVLGLVGELGLTSRTSLLELEPGLGGSTRAIARASGAWVTAFASDADLAERAAELSVQSGCAKKAAVQSLDVAHPGFKKKCYDHALAAHGLADIEPLDEFLGEVRVALKPKGKLVIAQFVAVNEAMADDALVVLGPLRSAPAELRTADELSHVLGMAGFSITETRSSGAVMRSLIVQAWSRFMERLRGDDVDPRYGSMILAECVRWVRVDAMMKSGALDHVTILAERT